MTIKELINGIDQLVSLPDAVIRANELLESPHASTAEIGEVISHDPALSAKLLKLVNSAFYSFPGEVDSISRAITLIGTDELRSLIIAASATAAFSKISPERVDMDTFWHRSVYCGLMAKKIATYGKRGKGEAQFLTGLLHDVGKLVLFIRLPEQAESLLKEAEVSGRPLHQLEQEHLGFTTAELGGALLESWRLPRRLWEAVKCQHTPMAAERFIDEAHVLSLALTVTDKIEPELKTREADTDLNDLNADTLSAFDLNAEQLDHLAMEANMERFEVLNIVNPSATTVF